VTGRRFGLELPGTTVTADVDRATLDTLTDAILDHKVLVLRGQSLDGPAHRRLLRRFGPVTELASSAAGEWVAPGSDRIAPPKLISVLAIGAETTVRLGFADAVGAYYRLPQPLRALADRSWAAHGDAGLVAHPVTRLHTETGDRGLLLGRHGRYLMGLGEADGRTLLELLQSHVVRPDDLLEVSCAPGDLVIADARAVQVRLPVGTRALEVAGDPPLGIDGQHSYLLPDADRAATSTRRTA
jgi:taurine dioxygenase